MDNSPIGVIDSGVGGLTILNSLELNFPHESFLYFGDTQHAPYGEKDIKLITHLTENMVRFMENKQVKGLVIACNTITASKALEHIRTTIPFVIEIVDLTVHYAISKASSQHFTILATDVTLQSNLYQNLIKKHYPQATLDTYSLPLLVTLAESKVFDSFEAEKLIADLAEKIENHSTVILGCTHYPFFMPLFEKYFDKSIKLIDSSRPTQIELTKKLSTLNLFGAQKKQTEYFSSGNKEKFDEIISVYRNLALTI